jgi:hypothetical protein
MSPRLSLDERRPRRLRQIVGNRLVVGRLRQQLCQRPAATTNPRRRAVGGRQDHLWTHPGSIQVLPQAGRDRRPVRPVRQLLEGPRP